MNKGLILASIFLALTITATNLWAGNSFTKNLPCQVIVNGQKAIDTTCNMAISETTGQVTLYYKNGMITVRDGGVLKHRSSNQCLGFFGLSMTSYCEPSATSTFLIVPSASTSHTGYFKIRSAMNWSQYCLSAADNGNIISESCSDKKTTQLWTVKELSGGGILLQNMAKGARMCMTVAKRPGFKKGTQVDKPVMGWCNTNNPPATAIWD